jgi:hypothetical protein
MYRRIGKEIAEAHSRRVDVAHHYRAGIAGQSD